ncbi:MAG: GAF domain-containing protein [Planctomycetia bacterium]|nr:GAF domain-containing protein [Planctomycetia bacterium]
MQSRLSDKGFSGYSDGEARNSFLRELHGVGSLPSVLRQFYQATGWRLTYHNIYSPEHPFSSDSDSSPMEEAIVVDPSNMQSLPTPLPPDFVRNMANAEEEWIPIEVEAELFPEAWCKNIVIAGNHAHVPIAFLRLWKNPEEDGEPVILFPEARRGAVAISDMLTEMQRLRVRFWAQEMEVATTVPICNRRRTAKRGTFAQRFRQLLEYARELLDMEAVGVYLLNTRGNMLKLRASVGLTLDRLSEKPRPLEQAASDMMALQGDIIVFDEANPQEKTAPPENFRTAIGVPLVTDRSLLGTCWFYSGRQRFVTDAAIQQAELLADHIALDLEREAFFRRHERSLSYRNEMVAAAQFQQNQLPVPAAWVKDVDLFGWTNLARFVPKLETDTKTAAKEESVSGDFFDWFLMPSGKMVVAAGDVGFQGLAGAVITSAVKSALRSHAEYDPPVLELMRRTHETLWKQSAGEHRISLFCGILSRQRTRQTLQFGMTGKFRLLHLKEGGRVASIVPDANPSYNAFLGDAPEFHGFEDILHLAAGESLVVYNDGQPHEETTAEKHAEIDRELGNLLSQKKRQSSNLFGLLVKNFFTHRLPVDDGIDQSVLVIRHRD